MRNILRLFLEDLKSLHGNLIAIIVFFGLAVTPALYAWFNTLGFWDPYSQTGEIEVAVANEDEGYQSDLLPEKIDAGDEVISTLRANTQFKWEFVDAETAEDGVRSGRYYAAIVIPSDFSEKLMTVFSSDAESATIDYYTNQKENAIAPRLTDEGATTLSVAIDEDFTKAVTGVALSTSSTLLSYMNGDGFSAYSSAVVDRLNGAIDEMNGAADEAASFASLVGSCIALIDANGTILGDSSAALDKVSPLLGEASSSVASGSQALSDGAAALNGALATADNALGALESAINAAKGAIGSAGGTAGAGDDALGRAREQIERLKNLSTADIAATASDLDRQLNDLNSETATIAGDLQRQNEDLSATGDALKNSLTATQTALDSVSSSLSQSAQELTDSRDQLSAALQSGDWGEIKKIIGTDPDRIAAFIAAPTKLEKTAVYAIADNGSAMAPFYTSLSLWIGAIFMVALMRTTVSKARRDTLVNPKPHQIYLGRFLIFLALSLVQSTIVGLGDLLFLGIQCVHPWLFMVTCWIAGMVFCNVIYTLTVSFGRVGEAIAVILLVLQVGGSGGIFPVVMSAELFQVIYPFLPFTHSMEAFQSCIAGIYGMQYLSSLGLLLAMAGPMLLLGLVLRRPVIRLLDIITAKLDETALFVDE